MVLPKRLQAPRASIVAVVIVGFSFLVSSVIVLERGSIIERHSRRPRFDCQTVFEKIERRSTSAMLAGHGRATGRACGARPELPEPPWRRAQPPPRAPITREAIVEAALAVLNKEGIEGLSMRRVAEELGTGAASLYWHVRNKEELFQLIFDRVTREIVLPSPIPPAGRNSSSSSGCKCDRS